METERRPRLATPTLGRRRAAEGRRSRPDGGDRGGGRAWGRGSLASGRSWTDEGAEYRASPPKYIIFSSIPSRPYSGTKSLSLGNDRLSRGNSSSSLARHGRSVVRIGSCRSRHSRGRKDPQAVPESAEAAPTPEHLRDHPWRCYCAVQPPSMGMAVPVRL